MSTKAYDDEHEPMVLMGNGEAVDQRILRLGSTTKGGIEIVEIASEDDTTKSTDTNSVFVISRK